eukprot:TRINITY_DN7285_c0_g2_i2.p1 TRINITY_DN7285_c0_g2~~TRINITY_DN7285_c0_g2_i2.p1  ORF type:complete len:726 (-),score=176.72 TRINITY_DN7285_c0_g2_i2:113-2290(-)
MQSNDWSWDTDPDLPKNFDDLQVFKDDPALNHFRWFFTERNHKMKYLLSELQKNEGGVLNFVRSYKTMGFWTDEKSITLTEWAPGATEMFLMGDFNHWDRNSHRMEKDSFGKFKITLPRNPDGTYPIPHMSKIKLHLKNAQGQWVDRIPAWIHYAIQDDNTKVYDGVYINWIEHAYKWQHERPPKKQNLKIYECHIGMAGIEPRVHTYKEFTKIVLPRIKKLGYNAIQMMAIMEHAYYGSFGYHVTNFFAISSRFGEPNDLKELIDTAHGLGITVLIDLVHSHASANEMDGINNFDGTDYQYFHAGGKGKHDLWDSRLFDYGKWEVLRFLLSNLVWWIKEYRFDGFRFDGITSMLYVHHGMGFGFSGGYHEYFNHLTDLDSLVYLALANYVIKKVHPDAITIAEDVSGMPGLGRPLKDGGVGFDYRLAMAIPDKWIKLLKENSDDEWNMGNIVHTLTNRRWDERCVSYAESHDQALVGDKTLAMWLLDAEIYTNMSTTTYETLIVNRAIALHKMIRLITLGLGGEAYLTFMGNEFGHPEWIDFPREGNGWSYHHARRRWDLADDPLLRYKFLLEFDATMINLEEKYKWLIAKDEWVTLKHETDKIIVFEKGGLLWVFNFHPTRSFEHYRIGTRYPYDHRLILDTDDAKFGGHDRLRPGYQSNFPVTKEPWHDRGNFIVAYIPNRCAMVFEPIFATDVDEKHPPQVQQPATALDRLQKINEGEKQQ